MIADIAKGVRSASRTGGDPDSGIFVQGFRLVRDSLP
jgi:hypothetical protein